MSITYNLNAFFLIQYQKGRVLSATSSVNSTLLRKESVNLKVSSREIIQTKHKQKIRVKMEEKKRLHMGALGQYQFNIPIIDAKARKEMEQTKYFKRKWLKIL